MFDVEKEVNNIITFIKKYFKENNLKGVIIGISGGKDSAVVSALFTASLGKENVVGVTLPCHSKEEDRKDALLVSEKYGFELINLDLTSSYDSLLKEVNKLGNYNDSELNNSNINLKPRLRMSSLYYLAALYTEIKGGPYIVAGTSNKCELFVGYFTKGGDSTYDIGVLNDFTVDEVIKIGEYLDVPKEVLYKAPNDGLSNKTDEDKLGVKYSEIASYINNEKLNKSVKDKIEKLHDS